MLSITVLLFSQIALFNLILRRRHEKAGFYKAPFLVTINIIKKYMFEGNYGARTVINCIGLVGLRGD